MFRHARDDFALLISWLCDFSPCLRYYFRRFFFFAPADYFSCRHVLIDDALIIADYASSRRHTRGKIDLLPRLFSFRHVTMSRRARLMPLIRRRAAYLPRGDAIRCSFELDVCAS